MHWLGCIAINVRTEYSRCVSLPQLCTGAIASLQAACRPWRSECAVFQPHPHGDLFYTRSRTPTLTNPGQGRGLVVYTSTPPLEAAALQLANESLARTGTCDTPFTSMVSRTLQHPPLLSTTRNPTPEEQHACTVAAPQSTGAISVVRCIEEQSMNRPAVQPSCLPPQCRPGS